MSETLMVCLELFSVAYVFIFVTVMSRLSPGIPSAWPNLHWLEVGFLKMGCQKFMSKKLKDPSTTWRGEVNILR
jgi:hypothetical protein